MALLLRRQTAIKWTLPTYGASGRYQLTVQADVTNLRCKWTLPTYGVVGLLSCPVQELMKEVWVLQDEA